MCAVDLQQQRNSVIKALKEGKFLLRNKDGEGALEAFTRSLKILNEMKYDFNDKVQAERKAYRGLGAAQSLMGSNEDALQSMERVLELTEQLGDGAGLGLVVCHLDLLCPHAALSIDLYALCNPSVFASCFPGACESHCVSQDLDHCVSQMCP